MKYQYRTSDENMPPGEHYNLSTQPLYATVGLKYYSQPNAFVNLFLVEKINTETNKNSNAAPAVSVCTCTWSFDFVI